MPTLLDRATIPGFVDEVETAYAAGFFDGEGYCAYKRKDQRHYSGTVDVSIGQASEPVLRWLQERFGGGIRLTPAGRFKTTKDFWTWGIVGTRAEVFLEAIEPYLKVKNDQVARALSQWRNRVGRADA